jgi:hypothetical protein
VRELSALISWLRGRSHRGGSPMFTPYGGSKGFVHAFMKGVALIG